MTEWIIVGGLVVIVLAVLLAASLQDPDPPVPNASLE